MSILAGVSGDGSVAGTVRVVSGGSVGGTGGDVSMAGGVGDVAGGSISMTSGNGGASGSSRSGSVMLSSHAGERSGMISLRTGIGSSGGSGSLVLASGSSLGGAAGTVSVSAGESSSGAGAAVKISSGQSLNTGDVDGRGGAVSFCAAGDGVGGGGDMVLTSGEGTAGQVGQWYCLRAAEGMSAVVSRCQVASEEEWCQWLRASRVRRLRKVGCFVWPAAGVQAVREAAWWYRAVRVRLVRVARPHSGVVCLRAALRARCLFLPVQW